MEFQKCLLLLPLLLLWAIASVNSLPERPPPPPPPPPSDLPDWDPTEAPEDEEPFSYRKFRKNIDKELSRNPSLSSPEECARECKVGEPPKTCYYHFTLELYTTLGYACDLCTPNVTNLLDSTCQCVLADGVETTIISINRMLPGPSIQVCLGDKIIVDVENKVEGMEVTIHWHGLFQKGSQYYDGVPFVTQCPIHQGNTFRYQFKAENEGTHFYHAHTGLQKLSGINGPLVVRKPKKEDVSGHLYDKDEIFHVIYISDIMHRLAEDAFPGHRYNYTGQNPDSFLINGKGVYTNPDTGAQTNTSYAVFNVTKGHRYRFRIIYSTATVCPSQITIEGHNLTLIGSDGESLKPVPVTSVLGLSAERYDVVLEANQSVGAYWIQLRGLSGCATNEIQQLAILRYEGADDVPSTDAPTYAEGLDPGVVVNPISGTCNSTQLCITELRNAKYVDVSGTPDYKIFMPFLLVEYNLTDVFKPKSYNIFLVPPGTGPEIIVMDGLSYQAAPYPLIHQYHQNDPDQFCDLNNKPKDCDGESVCPCTHVVKVKKGALVEIILVDEVGITGLIHPFHLHGFSYSVIGMSSAKESNVTKISKEHCVDLDNKGLLKRDFSSPPSKDTLGVPTNGYAVIRFWADNPGFWLFHCHFLYHLTVGMDAVFQVGDHTDLPPVPPSFPRCGNHLPHIW